MNNAAQSCRLCGSLNIAAMGAIPDSDYFAGRVLIEPLAGGRLYNCSTCGSMFRHPILSSSRYLELYERGNPAQWSGDSDRQDWDIIRSLIAANPAAPKILDVGCGTGDFLLSLPKYFQKFGIEPSAAADQAALRGVKIVARQIEDLPAHAQFDAVTIIDVIEHVVDPSTLLEKAYAQLVPGGMIIISTGDPECPAWRQIFKSKYWYVSFPEHITFPSVGFYRLWCDAHHAVVQKKMSIRYRALSGWRLGVCFLMQAVFYLSPTAFSWVGQVMDRLRASPAPRRQIFSPGIPGLFVDHHVLVIEKPRT